MLFSALKLILPALIEIFPTLLQLWKLAYLAIQVLEIKIVKYWSEPNNSEIVEKANLYGVKKTKRHMCDSSISHIKGYTSAKWTHNEDLKAKMLKLKVEEKASQ